MPFPLIPVALASLVGAGWFAHSKRAPRVPTEQEAANYRAIYEQAMTGKDISPEKLRALSKEYRRVGMVAEADMLIKRAELAEAPPEVKEARREALKKLLACTDIQKLRLAADTYIDMGGFGAAHALNERADALEAAERVKSAVPAKEEADVIAKT